MVPAVVVALAAGACSGSPEGVEPTPSSSGRHVHDKPPSLKRIDVGGPVWGSKTSPVKKLSSIDIVGSTAILSGRDKDHGEVVAAADVRTGEKLWSLREGERLGDGPEELASAAAEVVGSGHGAKVLVDYEADLDGKTEESGVAALGVRDGAVEWTYAAVPAAPADSPKADHQAFRASQLVDDAGGRALAVVGPSTALADGRIVGLDRARRVRTVALDPENGKPLWARRKRVAQRVVDDVVVATIPRGHSENSFAALVGLDPTSGERLWRRPTGHRRREIRDASDASIVVTEYKNRVGVAEHVISAATGRVRVDRDPPIGPVAGGGRLLAWTKAGSSRLVSLADSERRPATAAHPLPKGFIPVLAHDGYVFCTKNRRQSVAVDRSGNVVSERIDGLVLAMTDHYLVTTKRDAFLAGLNGFVVYRLGH